MKTTVADTSETTQAGEAIDAASPLLPPVPAAAAISTGRIIGFAPSVGPLVDFPGNSSRVLLLARSLVPLTEKAIGQEVALVFEDGDLTRPFILGTVQSFEGPSPDATTEEGTQAGSIEVATDGHRLLLTAQDEIVLRCGRASITLTAAGKVLIRGEYLLSRSSGANRIKGGSVQIN